LSDETETYELICAQMNLKLFNMSIIIEIIDSVRNWEKFPSCVIRDVNEPKIKNKCSLTKPPFRIIGKRL
jgi:hypothetical protein